MQLAKIAWRNLQRNKVRTAIAVLAIMTVVIIVIFARGFMVGSMESCFKMYIDNSFGHVRVTDQEYELREALLPLDYNVQGFDGGGASAMVVELEKNAAVNHVLPRTRFAAVASIDDKLIRMIGVGVDPVREEQYGALPADISRGRMPEAGNEILVGRGLLEKLGAEVDERVTLVFSDVYESIRGRTFTIVGARETGVAGLDDHFFYMPLATARNMLRLEDEVTELFVFASDAREAGALKTELHTFLTERSGNNYSTVVWNKADPFVEFYHNAMTMMDFVYLLFLLMGTVVVIITLTMIVRERIPEIGVMAALGLKSKEIRKLFVLEGCFMGIIGSLLGVIGGGLLTYYFSRVGLHVDNFAQLSENLELLINPTFYVAFNLENLFLVFALGVIIVTLSCYYPASKAAKLEPMEALHYIEE